MVDVTREGTQKTIQSGCRVTRQQFRFVQLEDRKGDSEQQDSAVDEEEIPNPQKSLISIMRVSIGTSRA